MGEDAKLALATIEGIDEAFLLTIGQHTAGSPIDEDIKWTNLTRQQIANLLKTEGINVSVTVVDQLLEKYKFRSSQSF